MGNSGFSPKGLFQVSTLNALMLGCYDGVCTVSTMLGHGGNGIGTVDRLDGEMIALDGVMYQAGVDGNVHRLPDDKLIPFGVTADFDASAAPAELQDIACYKALAAILDRQTRAVSGRNIFYMAKLDGMFAAVKVRSIAAQEKPYRPLAEVNAEQREFNFNNIAGSIVGVYCPAYMAGINMPGWHLHFLSASRQQGGHLLEVKIRQAKLQLQPLTGFILQLPHSMEFAKLSLEQDLMKETMAVEGVAE